MDTVVSSPIKRRAALAPLDANAMTSILSSPAAAGKMSAVTVTTPSALLVSSSPVKDSAAELSASLGRKRGAVDDEDEEYGPRGDGMMGSPAFKRACVDEDSTLSRSHSPDASSLFDTSAGDASWATTATDPDIMAVAPAAATFVPATRPRALTREQAREKAEILRLRLGLASYKLRTGQTSVPLAQLQPKPLPFPSASGSSSPARKRRQRANTTHTALHPHMRSHSRIHSLDSTRPSTAAGQAQMGSGGMVCTLSQQSSNLSAVSVMTGSSSASASMTDSRGPSGEEEEDAGMGNRMAQTHHRSIGSAAAAASSSRMLQPSPLPDGAGVLISTATQLLHRTS